jgi:hypothetical protein
MASAPAALLEWAPLTSTFGVTWSRCAQLAFVLTSIRDV